MMIALRKPVFVTTIDSYGSARTEPGQVVGVSRMHPPYYDVMVGGKVLSNLPADRVREIVNRPDIFGVVK